MQQHSTTLTVADLLRIVRERIAKDHRAQNYVDARARKIARVTLESLAKNIGLELAPFGLELIPDLELDADGNLVAAAVGLSPAELRKVGTEDRPRWYRLARYSDGRLILESALDAVLTPPGGWRFERQVAGELAADADPDTVAKLLKAALKHWHEVRS